MSARLMKNRASRLVYLDIFSTVRAALNTQHNIHFTFQMRISLRRIGALKSLRVDDARARFELPK